MKQFLIIACLLMMSDVALGASKAKKQYSPLENQLQKVQTSLQGLHAHFQNLRLNLVDLGKNLQHDVSDFKTQLTAFGYAKNLIARLPSSIKDLNKALDWFNSNPEKNDIKSKKITNFEKELSGLGHTPDYIKKFEKGLLDKGYALDHIANLPSGIQNIDKAVTWLTENPIGQQQGLVNGNGDDCFFSASFQVLSQIGPLIKALENIPEKQLTDIQREFLDFIRSLRGSGTGEYKPAGDATKKFRQFITSGKFGYPLNTMAAGQRDAQEFFSGFINKLAIDLKGYSLTNLKNIFAFDLISELKLPDGTFQELKKQYPAALQARKTSDPEWLLSIQIEGTTLKSCLDAYFGVEPDIEMLYWIVSGKNHKLDKPIHATRQFFLGTKLSSVLTIQFKRFLFGDLAQKVSTPISFDLHIDVAPYLEKKQTGAMRYNLFGIVLHSGSTNGGHYRAYTKDRIDGQWRYYNDATRMNVSEDFIKKVAEQKDVKSPDGYDEKGSPYLLFYERAA